MFAPFYLSTLTQVNFVLVSMSLITISKTAIVLKSASGILSNISLAALTFTYLGRNLVLIFSLLSEFFEFLYIYTGSFL